MSYACMQRQQWQMGRYSIIAIRPDDRWKIMEWRNEQLDILRQPGVLTRDMQQRYFDEVVIPQFSQTTPPQILVSYLYDDQLIGYGGLVHIQWVDKRAEVSFLLETVRNRNTENFKREYGIYLAMIKQMAFETLELQKLTTEAFDLRPYLIEALEENGFVCEGRLVRQNYIDGKFVDSILHACFAPSAK